MFGRVRFDQGLLDALDGKSVGVVVQVAAGVARVRPPPQVESGPETVQDFLRRGRHLLPNRDHRVTAHHQRQPGRRPTTLPLRPPHWQQSQDLKARVGGPVDRERIVAVHTPRVVSVSA